VPAFEGTVGACTKSKPRPLDGFGGSGGGAWNIGSSIFFDGRLSKKPPALNGGGEDNCGAEGVDFLGIDEASALGVMNEGFVCGGGNVIALEVEKFRPPKASVSPLKASCDFPAGGDAPPKDDCRLWGGGWG
jgi:hypothetical protein